MMQNITKLKKKKKLTSRADDLPLMPGQMAIYKDLCTIFNIIDDNPGIDATDILEQLPEMPMRAMRSGESTAMEYNLKNKDTHHPNRSIIRRHANLIKWICTCKITMV